MPRRSSHRNTPPVPALVPPAGATDVPGERPRQMDAARVRAGLTTHELWYRYVALTGTGDLFDVDGYLQGLTTLDEGQEVVLAQALTEAWDDGGGAQYVLVAPLPAVGTAWPDT